MKAPKAKGPTRGRRRHKSKLAQADDASLPLGARPKGQWILASRKRLFKYLPDPTQGPPLTFADVAKGYLRLQREFPPRLLKQLQWQEMLNDNCHGDFNAVELPLELLRQAMSSNPSSALESFRVVRRALARLYSVAWNGLGADSVESKRQLEKLLPPGNEHPVTKHLPKLALKFREMRDVIRESDTRMQRDFPREIDRVQKLAELYNENTGVISAARLTAEKPFIADRLAAVLGIPQETARKTVANLPAR